MGPKTDRTLSENEKKIIELINSGDTEGVKRLAQEPDVQNDFLDEEGMTALQHAAYKGNKELCEFFLARGADVNSNYHKHGYSALMFGALSGSTVVTKLLLEAGAKSYHECSNGRTASQLAAFVGQHECVSIINNFFSPADIERYTVPQGLETEAKLLPELSSPLYHFIMTNNPHPVKLSMYLELHPKLLEHADQVNRLLDLLVEKFFKAKDMNEIMAFRCHYLSCILREAAKSAKQCNGDLSVWIRSLVTGREKDGVPENCEMFLRSVVKSFPFIDAHLMQQMVMTLSKVKVGETPTALNTVCTSLYGLQFMSSAENVCSTCGDLHAPRKCSVCKMVKYCDQRCQKLQWPTHKRQCPQLAEEYRELEEQKKRDEEAERAAAAAAAAAESAEKATAAAVEGGEGQDGEQAADAAAVAAGSNDGTAVSLSDLQLEAKEEDAAAKAAAASGQGEGHHHAAAAAAGGVVAGGSNGDA